MLNKTKMFEALAELAKFKKFDYRYSGDEYSLEEYYKIFSACDELCCLDELVGKTEKYKISIVDENESNASDLDIIYTIFKIEDIKSKDYGYLRYKGRYSSWDSSYYTSVEVVKPVEVKKVQYVSYIEDKNF